MAVIHFENGFHGTYAVNDQILSIGHDRIQPYDMTYGALAACFYATFLEVLSEHGLEVKSADVTVEGRKRRSVPAMLEYVKLHLLVESQADEKELTACMHESLEKCSMFATVSKVAEIEAVLERE